MKYITIEVTQEDIDKGDSCSGSSCPIARALSRHRGDVGVSYWDWVDKEGIHPTSGAMQSFIEAFDEDKPVKPRRFRVPL